MMVTIRFSDHSLILNYQNPISPGTYLKTCEQSMSDSDRQFCQTNPAACKFCTQYECNKNEINLQAPNRQCYTCQGTDCLQSSLKIGACHSIDEECFTIFDGCKRSPLIGQSSVTQTYPFTPFSFSQPSSSWLPIDTRHPGKGYLQ